MRATVWTDGSCLTGAAGVRGPGGWAAVVERGSEGWTRRGNEENTTPSRMELRAVVEGLKSLPDGEEVRLRTDYTGTLSILHHRNDPVRLRRSRDGGLWMEVAEEFSRLKVTIDLVVRGDIDPVHQRCHAIAGAEAKSLRRGVVPETNGEAVRYNPRPTHIGGCHPLHGCAEGCPVGDQRLRRRVARKDALSRNEDG